MSSVWRSLQCWCFWFVRCSFKSRELYPLILVTSRLLWSAFFRAVFICVSRKWLALMDLVQLKELCRTILTVLTIQYRLSRSRVACCFPSSSPQPTEEIYVRYFGQHLSKKGLEVKKCRSKKLVHEGCFSCVIPKPAKGRPVVCGPEPLPTRGHVFCQKAQRQKGNAKCKLPASVAPTQSISVS